MKIGPVPAVDHCLSVVDAMPMSSWSLRGGGDVGLCRSASVGGRRPVGSLELSASFALGDWHRRVRGFRHQRRGRRRRGDLVVANEIAGQYEDNFGDIQTQMVNYFTYKAVRTVLHQLYEMNPPSYTWFYNYVATNDMKDGKSFLRKLVKEKQDLAERVMITRLHLYGKWIKKCDHAKMYQLISDENLLLMRERLAETIIWPSDDTSTGTIR